MSKVTWNIPQRQKAIEEDLRGRYGGMMTLKDIQQEITASHPYTAKAWLGDTPAVNVNNRKKWMVGDIAKKIYQSIVTPI